MKTGSFVLALLVSVFSTGCKHLGHTANESTKSAFLSQFSLSTTVARVSPAGLDCSSNSGGGIGSSAGGFPGPDSHSQSYSVSCRIDRAEQLKETELVQSLKDEVEKQIRDKGGSIKTSRADGDSGVVIEYSEGKLQGSINMAVSRHEGYYTVTARLDESNR